MRRGVLELRLLPFLEQSAYDHLLWLCDVNCVGGQDSFVRAQWAARSMVWHIYPQHEGAHLATPDAFLDLYCTDLPAVSATAVREFWQAWNVGHVDGAHWQNFALCLPTLREHARRWQKALAREDDLSTRLLRFARSRL